jgi:Na+-translocating ferredoxin:NAD+ oxidoreductase subunit G
MTKKLESNLRNMSMSLLFICATMAAALGFVYSITKDPIEKAEKQKINNAIRNVLPDFDNDPGSELVSINGLELYPAKKNGKMVGVAVKSFTNKGFSGYVSVMVGFKPDGSIYNTAIMSQKETPGLGTKMAEPKFRKQFNEKIPGAFKVSVKKDGGDVDAITAATISSRAFCDAIQKAFESFNKQYRKELPADTTKQVQGGIK